MSFVRSHIYLKILKTTLLMVLCTSSHLLGAVETHVGRGVTANRRYEHAPHRRGLDVSPEFRAKRAAASTSDSKSSGVVFVVNNNSKNNLTIDLHRCNVDDSNFCKTLNDSLSDQSVSVVSVVNLSQNYLQHLNYNYLNKFVNLQQLDLSSNNLSAIVSLASDRLEYLNVSGNKILRFSGEKLKNLKCLDLSSNQLNESRYIVLYDLLHLTSIDLSCNHLHVIDKNLFLNNRNLRHIDLSGNLLTLITRDTFNNLDNLEVLDLTNNNISWIENDTFSCLPSLQYLDLAGNDIHIASIRALQGIPDLIGLSLAFNRHLNDVNDALQGFVASWSLRELDISGTDLCDVPAALTQSVRMLNLADNYLRVINCGDLDSYPLLQHLVLSHNLIFDIEDDALGRLEILTALYLDHNQISRIPTSLPSSLVQLHLSANAISDIQPAVFAHLTSLLTLDLSANRIGYLQELPLPNLITLDMRAGALHGVSQAVVATSPKLKDLLLDGNPVKCADLLGIAAWASPCREEKLFATPAPTVSAVEYNFYFIRNTNQHCKKCAKHHKVDDEPRSINCIRTKIIATSNQLLLLSANEQAANGATPPPAIVQTEPTNNNDNNYTNSGRNENANHKIITFSNQLGKKVAGTGITKSNNDAGRKINDNDDRIYTKELTTTTIATMLVAEAGTITKETNDKSFDVINQFSERLSQTTDGGGVTRTLAHTTTTTLTTTQSHLLQFNDQKIGDNDKTDTEITKETTTTKAENNNDNKKKQQPMEELNFDMLHPSTTTTAKTVLLNDKTNDNKTFASTDKSDVLQAKSKLTAAGAAATTTTDTTSGVTAERNGSEISAKLHIYENDGQQQQQQQQGELRRRWQWLHKDQAFGNKAAILPTITVNPAPMVSHQQLNYNAKIMPTSRTANLITEKNDNHYTKLLNKTSSLSSLLTSSAMAAAAATDTASFLPIPIDSGIKDETNTPGHDKNFNLATTPGAITTIVARQLKENNKLIDNDKLSQSDGNNVVIIGNGSNSSAHKLKDIIMPIPSTQSDKKVSAHHENDVQSDRADLELLVHQQVAQRETSDNRNNTVYNDKSDNDKEHASTPYSNGSATIQRYYDNHNASMNFNHHHRDNGDAKQRQKENAKPGKTTVVNRATNDDGGVGGVGVNKRKSWSKTSSSINHANVGVGGRTITAILDWSNRHSRTVPETDAYEATEHSNPHPANVKSTMIETEQPPPPLLLLEHVVNEVDNKLTDLKHNINNTTGVPQKLNDLRHSSGHPGLFIIIGLTVGIILCFGLLHLYKCHEPHQQQPPRRPVLVPPPPHHHQFRFGHTDSSEFVDVDDDDLQTMHDLLRMEVLTSSSGAEDGTPVHQYSTPKERW